MSQIGNAFDGAKRGSMQSLRGSTGSSGYRAANVQKKSSDNSWAEAMKNFAQTGSAALGAFEDERKKSADERSNEIIRKLTPEQRRAAIEAGTLLYQDDPYAMDALREKTGRNAAFEVDTDIQTRIQRGEFRTSKEMQEYRQQRLSDVSTKYATDAGIDPNDTLYQKGFNSDISNRNNGLMDLHAQFLSKQFQAQASLETRNDLMPILDDVAVMKSTQAGGAIAQYINSGLLKGTIASDQQAIDTLTMIVGDAVHKDGGVNMLDTLKDQEIEVLGGKRKVSDLLGPEMYEGLRVKAMEQSYKRNTKRNEDLQLGIATALSQDDPMQGWSMLTKLENQNAWIQDGDEFTSQKQAIISAKSQLIGSVKRQSDATIKGLEQATQADNRLAQLNDVYQRRINGDLVSVDPKHQPVNENTGEFKESDAMTFANKKLAEIDQMQISEERKDDMRAAYLRADYQNGPFRAAMGTLIQDAEREWQSAVTTGQPGEFSKITRLNRMYANDPSTVSMLYPEKAGFLEQMNIMATQGIEPQVMVDAARAKPKNKEEERYREDQWASVKNDSKRPELKYIPNGMETMARSLFDAYSFRSGDSVEAADAVADWLQKNTVQFTEGGSWTESTSFHGMLSKKSLMTDPNDVKSWERGQSILSDTLEGLRKDAVWGSSSLTVSAAPSGDILIQSLTGQRIRITPQQLQMIDRGRLMEADAKRTKEAVKDAQRGQQLYNQHVLGGIKR